MKILNIENTYLFQDNDIPFYVICKKFVNFYNIFLRNKKNIIINDLGKKLTTIINEELILKGLEEKVSNKKNHNKNEKEEKDDIKINENIELEYEIKIPQFLIEYSEKTKNKIKRNLFSDELKLGYEKDNNDDSKELFTSDEENEDEDEDDNENELLFQEKDNKSETSLKKNKVITIISPKKAFINNTTPTPTPTPTPH
jgi:hypothetical protein